MKILVVGGAGYIGSVCAELLLDQGHGVTIFDNLSEGHRRALDPRAEFVEGDLVDRQSIEKTLAKQQPDAVMHFAANALVGESMQNPSKYFRNNVANGLNLLDSMISAGVAKIIFSSTCAIFGPPERVPIDETMPPRPINPYGESKLAFEKILRWYGEIHGLKLLQCGRRFGEIWRRPSRRNAFDPKCSEGCAWTETKRRDFWDRLRDAGRHLHPRLHPHPRSCPRPHPRAQRDQE